MQKYQKGPIVQQYLIKSNIYKMAIHLPTNALKSCKPHSKWPPWHFQGVWWCHFRCPMSLPVSEITSVVWCNSDTFHSMDFFPGCKIKDLLKKKIRNFDTDRAKEKSRGLVHPSISIDYCVPVTPSCLKLTMRNRQQHSSWTFLSKSVFVYQCSLDFRSPR